MSNIVKVSYILISEIKVIIRLDIITFVFKIVIKPTINYISH